MPPRNYIITWTGFFANIRFKSHTLNTFSSCLQSKEILCVHRRFRTVSAAESKKSGFGAANRPLQSPFFYDSPCILHKKQEKTSLVLVDKRGFFYGAGGGTWTRTRKAPVSKTGLSAIPTRPHIQFVFYHLKRRLSIRLFVCGLFLAFRLHFAAICAIL